MLVVFPLFVVERMVVRVASENFPNLKHVKASRVLVFPLPKWSEISDVIPY